MMKVRKEEGETRCRHVAYSCRIALRGPPGLTSPSDGRITINSDICLPSYALRRDLGFNPGKIGAQLRNASLLTPLRFLPTRQPTSDFISMPVFDSSRTTLKVRLPLQSMKGDNAGEMSPGSSTESYPAFARIELRENPGKNLNQITFPDRDSNPGHLVSQPDALTVTPQVWTE
ncbi:hypothetical protein ANN_04548 [Periplaneta americana]|uniref:Uncharacterized protein n=1 Tax=Periplaneta americana TaxID=6978 RepID=A0ABQ8TB92_PERAM|nr:hypothetical protein ANN_04548 [Periplaneta americana]